MTHLFFFLLIFPKYNTHISNLIHWLKFMCSCRSISPSERTKDRFVFSVHKMNGRAKKCFVCVVSSKKITKSDYWKIWQNDCSLFTSHTQPENAQKKRHALKKIEKCSVKNNNNNNQREFKWITMKNNWQTKWWHNKQRHLNGE